MEFTVAGISYRVTRPDARTQYRLLQRLAPVLPALSVIALAGSQAVPFAATAALAAADEGAVQAAIDGCLALAEWRSSEG